MPYTQCSEIDSFQWLNSKATNHDEYIELKDSSGFNRLPYDFPPKFRMVKKDNDNSTFVIALLSDEDERVVYYIYCEVWEDILLDKKPVTQLKLWRSPDSLYQSITSGLASKMFRVLLDTHNVVASDGVHTYSGRRFWQQELIRAIRNDLYVYRYDIVESLIERIEDPDVITDNSVDLWGSDERYMQILAVISKDIIKKGYDGGFKKNN